MAFRDQIVIQGATESRHSTGEVVRSWITYKTVWAEIEEVSSNVSYEGDMPVHEDGKSFRIYDLDAPLVTTKMRISYDSQLYYIRSSEKDGRERILIAEAYDDE